MQRRGGEVPEPLAGVEQSWAGLKDQDLPGVVGLRAHHELVLGDGRAARTAAAPATAAAASGAGPSGADDVCRGDRLGRQTAVEQLREQQNQVIRRARSLGRLAIDKARGAAAGLVVKAGVADLRGGGLAAHALGIFGKVGDFELGKFRLELVEQVLIRVRAHQHRAGHRLGRCVRHRRRAARGGREQKPHKDGGEPPSRPLRAGTILECR